MMNILPRLLIWLGNRIQNYGYLITNPSYVDVRKGKGCPDLYRLLNKAWFSKKDIQLVLDVGANEGQFIRTSLALMPGVPVYAFEPNPASVKVLQSCNWGEEKVIVFPVALGSYQETLTLNVSKFSPASSLLCGSAQLGAEFPETANETSIDVSVERLDALILSQENKELNILLKIDVQGFELEVLKGTTNLLDRILVIVCKVNLAPLYDNQSTIESILSFLAHHGYHLVDVGSPIRAKASEEILYIDLAFKRSNHASCPN